MKKEEKRDAFVQHEGKVAEAGAKRPITFASQFVEGFQGEGTLYAHVDDSFVRAYTLDAEALKALVPEKSQ